MTRTSPNALLVFPKFNPNSFWNLQAVCDIWGARCPAPPLGLITVAALLPASWNLRLVNRNAEELTDADLAWADLVMTGGMLPQQDDAIAVIEMCQQARQAGRDRRPGCHVEPGHLPPRGFSRARRGRRPYRPVRRRVVGGAATGVFEGEKFQADVTKSPTPRFDLLNFEHYLYVGVQFSRGCPFNCEFCDIIELYGRVPRAKTNEQMLSELDTLYRLGHRGHVDFVDDNLIGNKKALKRFLPALTAWQKQRGYPFQFSTEASMNLADDAELLRMLREANFFLVFVGIESPDTATLISMQKKQNTRRSLADSVHRIYQAGMVVIAGFIVGFDNEAASVADTMADCIEATSIPVCHGRPPHRVAEHATHAPAREGRPPPAVPGGRGRSMQRRPELRHPAAAPRRAGRFPRRLAKRLRTRRLFRAGANARPHARPAFFARPVLIRGDLARVEGARPPDPLRDVSPDRPGPAVLAHRPRLPAPQAAQHGIRAGDDRVLPAPRHASRNS